MLPRMCMRCILCCLLGLFGSVVQAQVPYPGPPPYPPPPPYPGPRPYPGPPPYPPSRGPTYGHPSWSEPKATGYFGIGFSEPVNPLATHLDTGWGFAGGAGVTYEYAGLMVDVMYNRFSINGSDLQKSGARHGSQAFWAITLDPILHINQRGPLDFYVTGGGGLYGQILRYKFGSSAGPLGQGELAYSNTIYKAGVDAGAGFAFNIAESRAKIFVEARFHHMFTHSAGASFVPVTVGVRF